MKLSVIYDSKTGNTKQAAEWIAEGMRQAGSVEAEAFSIAAVDENFVNASKGVVIGCPTYAALMTPDLRSWLMNAVGKLELAGKMGGAFATEQYSHGGADLVIQSILTNELVFGMLCYSGGRSYGHPVIHLGPVGVNGNKEAHNGMEHYKGYFMLYGERFARQALKLFGEK